MLTPSGRRAVERCDLLGGGAFTEMEGGLYRPYLGPAHRAALDQITAWMEAAGMSVRLDPAASLIGRYDGIRPDAPALLIGSHIDSVRDAGRYDGPLGIMLGIECVASLQAAGRRLPFAIEIVAFGDEEGSRFPAAMLGSRAMAGLIDDKVLHLADSDGIGLDRALADWRLDRAALPTARRDPATLVGYFEAHIEQGPVLEAEGLPLGIVTGIAAQRRFAVTVTGIAGHAGTNSMRLRKDALAGAAEAVLAIERIARSGPADLVATVGQMSVLPGAANVVPGRVGFSVDVRAATAARRDHAADEIVAVLGMIAAERGLTLDCRLVHDLPPAPCAAPMMTLLDHAVTAIGERPHHLVSGAGHDAMALAAITPMAMLFLRCKDGVSHNPAESVTGDDADLALRAMVKFLDLLADAFHD